MKRKRLEVRKETIRALTAQEIGGAIGGWVTVGQTNEDCTTSMNTYCQCGDTFVCPEQTHFFCPR